MNNFTQSERGRPGAIILVSATLISIGLIIVASATAGLDRPLLGPRVWTTTFGRQVIFALAGIAIMFITARIAPAALGSALVRRRACQLLFVAAVVLLALALVPGFADPHRGSHRWLRLAPIGINAGFQPSELAKLAMVAFLAWLLAERSVSPRSFRACFLPAAIAIGICLALVGKENFGTAALLACIAGAMLLVAGCAMRHLLLFCGAGACGLAVLLFAAPYRIARLAAYREFWDDPQGKGYQPLQSLTAIASGGWFGTGLGAGIQKYGYLPESHSDFVFAVLCEEMGIFGGALVILLFCAFAWVGLRTMRMARSPFERLLAFGLTFLVTLQAAMNIAVVTVWVPTTGVPLPMLSAGGSGLITTCVAVGVLAAIAARGENQPEDGIANSE